MASAIALAGGGCSPGAIDPRPSIALVVIDTLRADAVSAYGAVEGTTPAFDALAARGLLYRRAYAPSPWTLPSHASLLTGFEVDRHGVGMGGTMGLSARLTTLAERLDDAGYQTAGFSENPLVSGLFGFDQGFGWFSALSPADAITQDRNPDVLRFDVVREIAAFAEERDRRRPFFLFVNLLDPHTPYLDRGENRFLDPDLSVGEAWNLEALKALAHRICDRLPSRDELRMLRALYLGDVAEADAKLARIEAIAREMAGEGALIVVATSDHGEHFGEHRLLGHEFSVRAPVLNIPLVVHGAPDTTAGRIDRPVTLADVAASVLDWARVEIPPEVSGRPLPTRGSQADRPVADLLAVFSDEDLKAPEHWSEEIEPIERARDAKRSDCWPRDRVYGRMAALTRWPFKLIWFENYPAELYDLSWDPAERSDLAALRPEIGGPLASEAERLIAEIDATDSPGAAETPSAEELDALRGLGYVE